MKNEMKVWQSITYDNNATRANINNNNDDDDDDGTKMHKDTQYLVNFVIMDNKFLLLPCMMSCKECDQMEREREREP